MSDTEILLETGTNELEVAEFGIKTKSGQMQSFGINVAKVREIIKVPAYTNIPETHANIMGVFKLRNKTIPLIDLSGWLGESTDIDLNKAYVIVTEFNQANFGFLVHQIETIHRMSWQKVLPPTSVQEEGNECITGIIILDKKVMMMIDFEKIVTDINPQVSLGNIKAEDLIKVDDSGGLRPIVFLADDSALIRQMVTQILEQGGFKVISHKNGKYAWDHLTKILQEAKENKKDITDYVQLIVSDIEMPQMDGHSFARQIKESPDLKHLPVILFSSIIYEELRLKGEKIGVDAQIAKPQMVELVQISKELIAKNKKK